MLLTIAYIAIVVWILVGLAVIAWVLRANNRDIESIGVILNRIEQSRLDRLARWMEGDYR